MRLLPKVEVQKAKQEDTERLEKLRHAILKGEQALNELNTLAERTKGRLQVEIDALSLRAAALRREILDIEGHKCAERQLELDEWEQRLARQEQELTHMAKGHFIHD